MLAKVRLNVIIVPIIFPELIRYRWLRWITRGRVFCEPREGGLGVVPVCKAMYVSKRDASPTTKTLTCSWKFLKFIVLFESSELRDLGLLRGRLSSSGGCLLAFVNGFSHGGGWW